MSSVQEHGVKYTYKDYITWPENERRELIHGIPYNMSPAPSRQHQQISRALERAIDTFLVDKPCEMYHAPFDVRFPGKDEVDESITTVVQPDILVVCDEHKLDDKGCNGAPDFIIEIMSKSTAAKDMNEKLFLYEEHKVKEYWIIDPWDNTIKIYLLDSSGKYSPPQLFSKNEKIDVVTLPGLIINVDKIFAG
ncbi:MAG: Uma2 family endonuclease [Spirochaetales bacterium]|nr:Uma2 family endonuclease [Spirochaetales bacterium]